MRMAKIMILRDEDGKDNDARDEDGKDNDAQDEDEEEDEEDENFECILTPWRKSPVFDEFLRWLVSPDAKAKPHRQANQHVQQVMVILRDTSENTFDLASLFDKKAIRDKWLLTFEVKRKAGTVKSYISSLRYFYYFVIADYPKECLSYREKCHALCVITSNWISVFRQKVKKGRWKKDLEQLPQLFKTSDIQRLDNSELVSYCQKTIKHFRSHDVQPSQRQLTNVRDYLVMYLCLDNASRTGALANMTMREFGRATLIDGSYRINVLDHKTLATSGPACIVATSELYEDLLIYVHKMRNKLEGMDNGRSDSKKETYVFISWSGSKMSSSMVAGQINSFWGKAVGHTQDRPRVNANLVRKSAVSKVHQTRQDMRKDLANLMCHSEETAKRIYFLQEKNKKSGETSAALRSILRQPDPEEDLHEMILKHFAEEINSGKITLTIVREKKHLSQTFSNITVVGLRDKIRYMTTQRSNLQGIVVLCD